MMKLPFPRLQFQIQLLKWLNTPLRYQTLVTVFFGSTTLDLKTQVRDGTSLHGAEHLVPSRLR